MPLKCRQQIIFFEHFQSGSYSLLSTETDHLRGINTFLLVASDTWVLLFDLSVIDDCHLSAFGTGTILTGLCHSSQICSKFPTNYIIQHHGLILHCYTEGIQIYIGSSPNAPFLQLSIMNWTSSSSLTECFLDLYPIVSFLFEVYLRVLIFRVNKFCCTKD